jgi:hypothetical protein
MEGLVALILSIVLMVVGLAGVVLPFVPGVPLAWLGLFIYASATGFETISWLVIIVFLVITLILTALDFLAPMWGARKYKASKWGTLGAFLGAIIGVFTLGIWGIIFGPFLGAIAGELIAGKGKKQALKSAWGTLVGFILGTLVRLVVVLVMFGFLLASF